MRISSWWKQWTIVKWDFLAIWLIQFSLLLDPLLLEVQNRMKSQFSNCEEVEKMGRGDKVTSFHFVLALFNSRGASRIRVAAVARARNNLLGSQLTGLLLALGWPAQFSSECVPVSLSLWQTQWSFSPQIKGLIKGSFVCAAIFFKQRTMEIGIE